MKSLKLVLALAAIVCTPIVAPADGNTGIVRGVVRSYETEMPIRNALVFWANPSSYGSSRTDAQGRFYFLDVTPGLTTISTSGSGFNPNCVRGSVHANETVDVVIGLPPAGHFHVYGCRPLHASGREAVEDRR